MVEIKSPFFSIAGQTERLKNVADTFKQIGSNLISGKLLTGVPVAKKYEGTIVEPIAKAVSSPAFLVAAPAVVAGAAVFGPAIAAKVTSSVAAAKTAVSTYVAKKKAPAPTQANVPPAPTSSVVGQVIAAAAPKMVAPRQETIQLQQPTMPILAAPNVPTAPAGTTTSFYKTADAMTGIPENSVFNTGIGSAGVASSPGAKKVSARRTRKAKKVGRKKNAKARTSLRTHKRNKGHKVRSSHSGSRKIFKTKSGQPYIILASGKARFIKKSSAHNRKLRKGGYY